ncbi:hypothetical protein HCN44_010555 [Aphidius gifuensis]|uniref:PDZ domain-containing protein n=1 Tax=Aphidius gifuensis TaxID=684658 RepID=A0A835CPD5_APHGI|nr:hypothetical protein HCN44_010555 [Aphidius gifuensis]
MSWFSSKKKNNIPDPKLIAAASISVDQELNTDDGKIKDDESKNKQDEPTGKKKFGTWGKKIGKKLQKQKKRSKSTGSSKPVKNEYDNGDDDDKEKETPEISDTKRASRIDSFKNFFRSINTENKETINKIEVVQVTESETLVDIKNSLDDDTPVEPETEEVNESSSVKEDVQDFDDETNNVEDVDKKNDNQNFMDEEQVVLKINESNNDFKKSIQRSNSLNASNKNNNNLNFTSNSLVKFSKNHPDSKMQDKNKTTALRRSVTLSSVNDLRQVYQLRRESGYDSDTGSPGSSDSINTLTASTQKSQLSIVTLRNKNIHPDDVDETNNKKFNQRLSTLVKYSSQAVLNNNLASLDLDFDNASSLVNDSSTNNSWSDRIHRTKSEFVIWPQAATSQSSSIDDKLTPINSPRSETHGGLKKDEKYFSTMTLNYKPNNDHYNQTTGMKKFQIIRKNNLTHLELTQLADSLLMILITVSLWKGGTKKLGFSIVGGADNKNNNMGVFIKGIITNGQAAENGMLQPGDQILAINGQLIDRLMTHAQVLQIIKNAKPGKIIFHVGRKY